MASELESLVYPQFFPEHWLVEAPEIVHSHFPSGIRVGYVLRKERSYSYLMEPRFEAASLTLEQLHEAALNNLRALPMPKLCVAKTPGGPEAWLEAGDDDFTAARILLPEVRDSLMQELEGEFYFSLPCRDWMMCWNIEQSHDWQERNRREAIETFLSDDYRLTPDIFICSKANLDLHLQQPVEP